MKCHAPGLTHKDKKHVRFSICYMLDKEYTCTYCKTRVSNFIAWTATSYSLSRVIDTILS